MRPVPNFPCAMTRKTFFLTLSHVEKNSPSLSIEDVILIIKTGYQQEIESTKTSPKILVVQELHSDGGIHFHCVFITRPGISKNKYKSLIRR